MSITWCVCCRLEVKSKAPLVMLEVLVRAGSLAGDVRRHRGLLLRCTRADSRAQRAVLHALTALCAHHAELLPKVPAILKVRHTHPRTNHIFLFYIHIRITNFLHPQLLYDEDIVEEKAILEWAAKPSRKYASKEVIADVRRRAAPFLEWLQQAEEDSSDGDDSEHDIEVRYTFHNPYKILYT